MPIESTDDQLLFEYEELRKEILQNDLLSLQIMNLVLLITGGVAGFVFSQSFENSLKAALFFFAALLGLVGMAQNIDRLRSTNVIGMYLKIFLEPRLRIKWETRLTNFRSLMTSSYGLELISSQRVVYTFLVLGDCAFGIYYATGGQLNQLVFSTMNLIWVGIFAIIVISLLYQWLQYGFANSSQLE